MPSTPVMPTDAELARFRNEFRALVFSSPLFRDLDEQARMRIVERAERRCFDAGETLIKQGDAGDALFVIVGGTVRVQTNAGTSSVALADLGKGACVGEVALFSSDKRTATVTANAAVECARIEASLLREIADGAPGFETRLRTLIEARAHDAVQKIIGE